MERLAEADSVGSVGSRGDSHDNALAQAVNGQYKAELINRHGLWRSVEEVELATAEWVHFLITPRLNSAYGDISPAEFKAAEFKAAEFKAAEFKAAYHQRLAATAAA